MTTRKKLKVPIGWRQYLEIENFSTVSHFNELGPKIKLLIRSVRQRLNCRTRTSSKEIKPTILAAERAERFSYAKYGVHSIYLKDHP